MAAVTVLSLTGCAPGGDGGSPTTVTETVTAAPSSTTAPSPAPRADAAALRARFQREIGATDPAAGLAIAPAGTGAGSPVVLGNRDTRVAWSTIKVPLAIAAQRANGGRPLPAATPAIVDSDNGAAETLWSSLGTAAQAAAAVTGVLREGGDATTTVPSRQLRPPYTIFGQTPWPLPTAATFAAHLPCMPGTTQVISLMGRVAPNQQWGVRILPQVETAAVTAAAVKGGWGPGTGGDYLVRQLGLVTFRDGRQAGIAMSTVGTSMAAGIATLNTMATWLGRNSAALPRGVCG